MSEFLENASMVTGIFAFLLCFIGTINIHKAQKSTSSFLMLLSFVISIVSSIIYLGIWTIDKFYYGSVKSPAWISYVLASSDHFDSFVFLMGAIGFLGLSRSIKKEHVNNTD